MASNDITTKMAADLEARRQARLDQHVDMRSTTASTNMPIIVDFCSQNWPTKIVATNEGNQPKPLEKSEDHDRFLCLE